MPNIDTPELEDREEIRGLLESQSQADRDKATGKILLDGILGIVNARHSISGLGQKLGQVADRIDKLNNSFLKAEHSSEKLTNALNRITLAGVIIAGAALILEIIKICKGAS